MMSGVSRILRALTTRRAKATLALDVEREAIRRDRADRSRLARKAYVEREVARLRAARAMFEPAA